MAEQAKLTVQRVKHVKFKQFAMTIAVDGTDAFDLDNGGRATIALNRAAMPLPVDWVLGH